MFELRVEVIEYFTGNGEKTISRTISTCGVELPQLFSETIVAVKDSVVRIISDNKSGYRSLKKSITHNLNLLR